MKTDEPGQDRLADNPVPRRYPGAEVSDNVVHGAGKTFEDP